MASLPNRPEAISRWARVAAISLPLGYLLIARLIFGFDGLSGQDGHEYARYAGAIGDWLFGGEHPGWHYWGIGYSLTGGLLGAAIGDPVLGLQALSAVSLGVTALAVLAIARRLAAANMALHADTLIAITVLAAPAMALAGVLVMSDLMASALICLAILAWLELRHAPSSRGLMLFALAMSAAIWTRYGSFVLLAIPALDVLRIALARLPKRSLVLALIAVLPFVATHLVFKQEDAAGLFAQYSLQSWSPANWFLREFSTADGATTFALPNLAFVLSSFVRPSWWPLLLLLPFARPRDLAPLEAKLLLAAMACFVLFLAGIPFQNPRFQLPLAPLAAALLLPAAQRLVALVRGRPFMIAALVVVCLMALPLQMRLLTPHVERNRLEQQIAEKLRTYPAATPLFLLTFDPALINRQVRQPMHNLWKERYQDFPDGALVLFAPERLAKQWRGRSPMLNWEHLSRVKRLSVEAEFGGGWRLYRVLGPV